jgi:hypothetical protein
LEKSQFPYNISFIKFQLIGTEGTRLLREKRGQGDPAGERRGGSRTARGKRVPGVESECLEWKSLHIPLSEIRSLSADFLPSHIKASASGVLVSQLFGRSVANLFNPMRLTVKNFNDHLVLFEYYGSG